MNKIDYIAITIPDRNGVTMRVSFAPNKITVRHYEKYYTTCNCITCETGKAVTTREF